ncbi:unnamed protein product [Linum trigynum]|uniref:F-box domain-containing protein n=1 Tax=Linum trigynum TaxID=586398 RepID=A0AAV2G0F5_9ROSI
MASSASPLKSLPEDLLIEILTRLQVKSILRSKSVSKRWSTLLTTPQFIAAHLHCSASDNPLLIIRHGQTTGDLRISVLDSNLATVHRDLPVPVPRYDDFSASIVGSCNGLLCLEYRTTRTALWNPATKQFAWIPELDLRSPFRHVTRFVAIAESYGFGFNGEIEDYRWVKFAGFYYRDWRSEDEAIWESLEVKAAVFSWKSWSWKELRGARIPAASYGHAVAANGHLYWIGGGDGMRDFVLTFDLVADSFRIVDLPEARPDDGGLLTLDIVARIAAFRSCLELRLYDDDELEVLVIGENGVDMRGETWEFMCRYRWFDSSTDRETVESCCEGLWKGLQIFRLMRGGSRDQLYLFDPGSRVIRRFDDLVGIVFGVGSFVHSLVPVRGVNNGVEL